MRFGKGGNELGGSGAATTIEALAQLEVQKKKKQDRAERFGIVTKEMHQDKIKERKERFGIATKESRAANKEVNDAKKAERMKRFALMDESADQGMTTEELDAKRKARIERFGAEEVEETQKESVANKGKGGFKANKRQQKMNRKNQENGKGFKNGKGNGKKFKRFKGNKD